MKPELHFTDWKGNIVCNNHDFIAGVDENNSETDDLDTDSSKESESDDDDIDGSDTD